MISIDILLLADVHIRDTQEYGRPRLPIVMRVLEQAYQYALSNHIPRIAILGDLIDNRYKVSLDVLLTLVDFLRSRDNVQWYLMGGNHEFPDKNSRRSFLHLLYCCQIIVVPRIEQISGSCSIVWMPWYEEGQYLDILRETIGNLRGEALLFTHIGLKDGKVSESNYHPQSKVGSEDLFGVYPWRLVLLGDYHMAQQVGLRPCYYLGAPIAHRQGEQAHGMTHIRIMLNTRGGPVGINMWNIPIQNAPKFKRWEISLPEQLPIQAYEPGDYNLIVTTPELEIAARNAHQGAKIQVSRPEEDPENPEEDHSVRMEAGIPLMKQVNQYLEYKGIGNTAPYLQAAGEILGDIRGGVKA